MLRRANVANQVGTALIRAVALWGLVAALATPARAAPAPAPLLQVVRAQAAVAYRGEQIVVAWNGATRADASLVRIEHDPPAWTRLDYVPLGPSRRWTVIRSGTVEIRFDPLQLTGTTGRAGVDEDDFEAARLPWLLQNYRVITAQDALLGRKATRLELAPVAHDRPTHRLTVDDETGVVLRSERAGPDGSLGEVTAFLKFEIMPVGWRRGAVIPSDLHLTPREPVRAASAADIVRVLGGPPAGVAVPAGFHKTGEYLTGDGPVVQTIYSDGLSTLVVYERRGSVASPPQGSQVVATPSGPIWVQRLGLRTLVHWSHTGRVLTMVGEVSRPSLLAAAERTGIASAPRLWDRLLAWLQELIP